MGETGPMVSFGYCYRLHLLHCINTTSLQSAETCKIHN